jgi:preprotein translocase subunit YajC
MEMIILFVPLMIVWYFLLIRPQRAQAKKREETLKAIRRGDQIVDWRRPRWQGYQSRRR